jgi:hypothetical protein
VCADPSLGSPDGAILRAALQEANRRGLLGPGDRVVVSQCPRINDRFGGTMAEAGVVKILTIGADGMTPDDPLVVSEAGLLRCSSRHVFGSRDANDDCSDLV